MEAEEQKRADEAANMESNIEQRIDVSELTGGDNIDIDDIWPAFD